MGLSEKKGWEWGRHGVTPRAELGSGDGWLEAEKGRAERARERALDSLRNLEVPSGVRGAKGQGSPTFDPDPPFS